ncbi:MAG: HK97 gp10 family phage protein [Clostridia bacterium]|nr:HK97 gp10 family phage protein [Clostridia bacterium]
MTEIKQRSMFSAEKVAQSGAAKLEAEAKRSAPWTDRTGLARQTIRGVSGWQGGKLRCGVTGNMDYSVYLEKAREGQNAVLWPTVQRNEQELMEQFRKVVR